MAAARDIVGGDAEAGRVARANARWYLSGLAMSLIGNSALSLVAGVWVKQLTGSSAQAGLVSACVYAPTLLAPVAGLIADRLPRAPWLLLINTASALAILPLLLVHSRATTWIVFVTMAVYGVESTLSAPAEDALFVELFSADFRRRINGWRLAIQETGRLLAPLLGAGVFTVLGGGAVAALDAATFLFAAIVITRLRLPARPTAVREPARDAPIRMELTAGYRQLAGTPEVCGIAAAAVAIMALSGIGVAAQFSLVHAVGRAPAFLGVFSALLGGSSVVASLTAGRLTARHGERMLAVIGLINFALGTALRAVPWLPGALLGTLILGFALPYVFLAVLTVSQRLTPDHLQGRVSAALTLGLFGPQAPMQALGSLLIAHVGFSVIYVASAIASLMIAAALITAGQLTASARPERSDPEGPDDSDRSDARLRT